MEEGRPTRFQVTNAAVVSGLLSRRNASGLSELLSNMARYAPTHCN